MPALTSRTLKFSEPFVKVDFIEGQGNFSIRNNSVLINAGRTDSIIESKPLKPWTSSIYSAVEVSGNLKLICIKLNTNFFSKEPFPFKQTITSTWTHVYDVVKSPEMKGIGLWRSAKEKVGGIAFNLWFCEEGTDCGLHKEHDFRELHSQIFGIGRLQKFHQKNYATLFQDVFMSPGYTHEPFYDENCEYPWHQYKAETDCLWLAIEF